MAHALNAVEQLSKKGDALSVVTADTHGAKKLHPIPDTTSFIDKKLSIS